MRYLHLTEPWTEGFVLKFCKNLTKMTRFHFSPQKLTFPGKSYNESFIAISIKKKLYYIALRPSRQSIDVTNPALGRRPCSRMRTQIIERFKCNSPLVDWL